MDCPIPLPTAVIPTRKGLIFFMFVLDIGRNNAVKRRINQWRCDSRTMSPSMRARRPLKPGHGGMPVGADAFPSNHAPDGQPDDLDIQPE